KLFKQLTASVREPGWASPRLLLIGAGPRKDMTPDRLRRVATVAGLTARQRKLTRLAIVLRPSVFDGGEMVVKALAEGIVLANFEGASYKTSEPPCTWLDRVQLRIPVPGQGATEAVERGLVLGECTNLARELSNEPGNALTPRAFAD